MDYQPFYVIMYLSPDIRLAEWKLFRLRTPLFRPRPALSCLRRGNAGLRRNNGVLRQNNFHCPSGWGVIISHYSCEKCPFCPYEDRFLSFSPNMKNVRMNLWPYVGQFCSKLQLSGDSMFHEFYVWAKIN